MNRKAQWGEFGIDWFAVEAVIRLGKGGVRSGGCEYRFRVSALDKLRQSVATDELDPMQGRTVAEVTAILKRRSALQSA